jgi:hypothetical protein
MSIAQHSSAPLHVAPSSRGAMAGRALMVALSTLSSLLVAGCGGAGTDDAAVPAARAEAAATASVRLEGCVVDAQWLGAAGVAVHARMADGRAVGSAHTDSRGVFVLSVPARAAIVVGMIDDAQGGLAVNTGSGSFSAASCLLAGL